MKIFRNRTLPKTWLSVFAIGALFLGFASSTVKASNDESGSFFNLSAISEYFFGAAMADSVQFTSVTYTADEGSGFATVTVTRTEGANTTATVQYQTNNNGSASGGASCATAGVDYIFSSGTLTFQPGVSSQSFVIPICNDNVFEAAETFNVDLFTPTNTGLGQPTSTTVTITDNDPTQPGTLQFSPNTYTVSENAGTATLTVIRTGGSNGTVSAQFTLSDAASATGGTSCVAGVDYINPAGAPDGTVTFTNGQTSRTFTVTICDDGILEANEAFTATLSNPQGGAGFPQNNANTTATVTIVDNETPNPGTIQLTQTVYNVIEGQGFVTLTATRTAGSTGTVSAQYTTVANGTATAVTSCTNQVGDFQTTTGTVSFANNETEKTFTIPICNDNLVEGNETFQVALQNLTGGAALGAPSIATVVIQDDENGVFQFSPTSYTVSEGVGTVAITVTRTGTAGSNSLGAVTVDYATTNGPSSTNPTVGVATGGATCPATNSTTAGVDYITQTGTLSFAANQTSSTFNVTICNDAAFELNPERFSVTLSNATGGAQINSTNTVAEVIINDDDTAQPGTLSITATPNPVTEGGVVTFTITRSGGTDTAISVPVTITQESATGGTTSTCTTTGTVDFTAPTAVGGGGNSFGNPFNSTFANSQTAGGTQTNTFQIATCDDTAFEPNETFLVSLGTPTGPTGQPQPTLSANNSSVRVTIVDNDANAGQLNFASTTQTVNESAGTVTITVNRTNGTDAAVTANYTLFDGPAPAATGGSLCTTAGVDYVNPTGLITFASGQSSQSFTVPICNDTLDENNENFTVVLSNPTGGVTIGGTNQTVVTILDDEEGTIQFSAANYTVVEDSGVATITVNRTSNAGNIGTVQINYSLTNGTAVGGNTCAAGVDFIDPNTGANSGTTSDGTLTFAPGVNSQSFAVQICPDAFDELDETVNITLRNATNGALIGTQNTAVLTILDDDATPTLAISNVTQVEGNAGTTNFVFTVSSSAVSNQIQTVNFTTANGTAVGGTTCAAGVDYITQTGTLTFAAGTTTGQTITVAVCGDLVSESDETFFVNLSGATNSTIPANTQGVGTITNDDGAAGTITFNNAGANGAVVARVLEDNLNTVTGVRTGNTVTFTLTNTSTSSSPASVNFTTGGGTAIGGTACSPAGTPSATSVDYITQTGTANFAAGTSTATVTVTTCPDANKEANETFFLTLSGANNSSFANGAQGIGIIIDNDRAIRADFDRDRRTDFSVYRPSNGVFYILQSINGLFQAENIGATTGDIPVVGDYDGDSAADLAFFRPSNGTFTIRRSTSNVISTVQFGTSGDIPLSTDINGDGITELAVFRPSSGTFFFSSNFTTPSTVFTGVQFGQNGDIPVPADYNGDGRTDLAVYRPTANIPGTVANASAFFVQYTGTGATYTSGGNFGIQFGVSSDIPVTGDFDGDGSADFTVFRTNTAFLPAGVTGAFFTFQSLTQTTRVVPSFGQPGDIPTIGDYDGDGTDDYAVFRPSGNPAPGGAFFYVLRSSDNGLTSQPFGASGDIPLPSTYSAQRATASATPVAETAVETTETTEEN